MRCRKGAFCGRGEGRPTACHQVFSGPQLPLSIRLFHINGEKTADLTIGMQNGRAHEVTWSGHAAAPAACIVEIKAGELNVVRKLTPMRR
jgi:L-aminopeptidase/D-esterase-like protein